MSENKSKKLGIRPSIRTTQEGIKPTSRGTKPIQKGVKPTSGAQNPNPPQGGTSQSNKSK